MIKYIHHCTLISILLPLFSAASPTFPFPKKTTSTLQWQNCTGTNIPDLQCANLVVPLDYSNPDGETITIGLNKVEATDSGNRVGSLLFNPGGPGISATNIVNYVALGVPFITTGVREHFDIIGMDPRGVGSSTPIKCDPEIWNQRVSYQPSDETSFQELIAYNRALGESCLNLTGPLLGHVDTMSVARDLENVRIALGNEKLNYLGISYGTMLGAAYAQLFPENIRVMALDGNHDHFITETYGWVTESEGYEREFNRFAAWCTANTTCPLYGQNVSEIFDNLVQQADKQPLPAPACVKSQQCRANVTGEELRFNAQNFITSKDPSLVQLTGWNGLATFLAEAQSGNATGLSTALAQSETDTLYPTLAIWCMDWLHTSNNVADFIYRNDLGSTMSPHTQGAGEQWTT